MDGCLQQSGQFFTKLRLSFPEVIAAPCRSACRKHNGDRITERKRAIGRSKGRPAAAYGGEPCDCGAENSFQRCNRLFEEDCFDSEAAEGVRLDVDVIGVDLGEASQEVVVLEVKAVDVYAFAAGRDDRFFQD